MIETSYATTLSQGSVGRTLDGQGQFAYDPGAEA
jgi:hypothetical protein